MFGEPDMRKAMVSRNALVGIEERHLLLKNRMKNATPQSCSNMLSGCKKRKKNVRIIIIIIIINR
jgi:hypothetical protein